MPSARGTVLYASSWSPERSAVAGFTLTFDREDDTVRAVTTEVRAAGAAEPTVTRDEGAAEPLAYAWAGPDVLVVARDARPGIVLDALDPRTLRPIASATVEASGRGELTLVAAGGHVLVSGLRSARGALRWVRVRAPALEVTHVVDYDESGWETALPRSAWDPRAATLAPDAEHVALHAWSRSRPALSDVCAWGPIDGHAPPELVRFDARCGNASLAWSTRDRILVGLDGPFGSASALVGVAPHSREVVALAGPGRFVSAPYAGHVVVVRDETIDVVSLDGGITDRRPGLWGAVRTATRTADGRIHATRHVPYAGTACHTEVVTFDGAAGEARRRLFLQRTDGGRSTFLHTSAGLVVAQERGSRGVWLHLLGDR